jgi:DNA invertase Pin-like site-specific DNA recombinase
MPKPYSDKFLLGLQHADPDHLGVQLAKLCIKANIPYSYVATSLNTTRMTLHAWFREGKIRKHNSEKIQAFMDNVEQALADGKLPASNYTEAKLFVETLS